MLSLKQKRVFLRADLNIPINQTITSQPHERLQYLIPTLNVFRNNGNAIILGTHIGRPQPRVNTTIIDEAYSTKHLIPLLAREGFNVIFEPDLVHAVKQSHSAFGSILLLENLRFFKGEQKPSESFAELLAATADAYVNDAFGLIHRNDASVTLLPMRFPKENRSPGLLVEKEITTLERLIQSPSHPFIVILGGCKVKDKSTILKTLLNVPSNRRPDIILIGGALAFPFLKNQGHTLGTTVVTDNDAAIAADIMKIAAQNNIELVFPSDIVATTATLDDKSTATVYPVTAVPAHVRCGDIGPATVDHFIATLVHAKTIFANGTMGVYEDHNFQNGTKSILHAIATSPGLKIIAGGDTLAAAHHEDVAQRMTFCSTGGGATLAFLSANNPYEELPALKALFENGIP